MTTNKAVRCGALTSKNKGCKNPAVDGSEYCGQHSNWETKTDKEKAPVAAVVATAQEVEQTITEAAGQALGSDPAFAKYEVAKRVAHTLACSSLVPEAFRGKPNDVFVAINMGAEVGLEPFQAIQSIAVIEGKPCLYGDGLIGVVRASQKCMWIQESLSDDGKTATCITQRAGDPKPVTATYSMTDAMQAGIDSKFNWKKHPKRMLQMRARAYCLRDAYPDLLKGLGVVEERQDHEDTPPPVTQYQLPKAQGGDDLGVASQSTMSDDSASEEVTLAVVERAIHQSDTMAELLAAGELAKGLSDIDQGTARITYKKMRKVLMEDSTDG
jgi:hypothetical protein